MIYRIKSYFDPHYDGALDCSFAMLRFTKRFRKTGITCYLGNKLYGYEYVDFSPYPFSGARKYRLYNLKEHPDSDGKYVLGYYICGPYLKALGFVNKTHMYIRFKK